LAIAFISAGASDTGTTAIDPVYPASIGAGDGLLMFVANKYPPALTFAPGFDLLARYSGGQGASGVDAGIVQLSVFFREAVGGETGTVAVTNTLGNSGAAVIHRYIKDPAKDWDVAVAGGSDNTAGVTWLINGDFDPGFDDGDVMVLADAINADLIGFVGHSITVPGVTFGSLVVGRASQSWTDGDDGRLATHEILVAGGPSSGVPVWTFDRPAPLANAPAGCSVFVRLRDVDPPDPPDPPEPVEVLLQRRSKPVALRTVGSMAPIRTGIPAVDRAQDQIVKNLNALTSGPLAQAVAIEALLAPGLNKVGHGMKRPIRHFLAMPSAPVALANRQASNPDSSRTLWIEVDGDESVKALILILPGAA
jgi:hypothetical protein